MTGSVKTLAESDSVAGSGEASEIGIVIYPGAQLAAAHGLTDLFDIAGRIAAESRRNGDLRVSHWSPVGDGIACVYRSEPSAAPRPQILVLPPTLGHLPDPQTCAAIARWLHEQHSNGVQLATVCSGVFLVAGTGLLDGRTVSTHRGCARALTESFPRIAVNGDERMIEHPGILTAGGFMAWIDVGLLLIERLLGEEVRAQTARFALAGQGAGPGRPSFDFMPRQAHDDAAVLRAQELVHRNDGQGVQLAAMAAAARLERRTFLRRFMGATGMTPIEYCRAVRIARARELLEAGSMPLKRIAESLGYTDVSSFARAFRRVHGVPPGVHRKRHGGAVAGRFSIDLGTAAGN